MTTIFTTRATNRMTEGSFRLEFWNLQNIETLAVRGHERQSA